MRHYVVLHVVHNPTGGWDVTPHQSLSPMCHHAKQREAISHATKIASRRGSRVIVHRLDGHLDKRYHRR